MPKYIMKKQTAILMPYEFFDGSISDIVKSWQELAKKYGKDAVVSSMYYADELEIYITYKKQETDAEYNTRLKQAALKQAAQEKKQYARLKKKYG